MVFATESLDPRVRRTRNLLRDATRRLLDSHGSGAVTYTRVAQEAGVNRGTVHEHYASVADVIADALSAEMMHLAGMAKACPFADPVGPPPELAAMAQYAQEVRRRVSAMRDAETALVTARIADALAGALERRFEEGHRPPVRDGVPVHLHARFLAAGIAQFLVGERAPDVVALWNLIVGNGAGGTESPRSIS